MDARMNILVFGGAGFIGSAIVDRLLQDQHSLRVFERPGTAPYRQFLSTEQVDWLQGDWADPTVLGTAMQDIDAVVHLVSTTLPKNSNDNPAYDVQSNLLPTLHMLDAMRVHHVKKIVFISSGGTVYGTPQYLPIDEQHPTNPVVSYGITKLMVEKYLHMHRHLHALSAISLRVANPYGERQKIETAQGAVGVFLHRALRGQTIDIWGDGSVTRDYIHVSDVANAFACALAYNGTVGCFNISSGTGTSLNQLINMLQTTLGCHIATQMFPGRKFDVPSNVLSNALARQHLGWQPHVNMQQGLARTAQWMRGQIAAS
jgi:UDP-glucose 4-epimerase